MDIISCERERNYLPRDFSTRIKESGRPIKKAANIYHVSRKTIWRWLTKYDGTEGSLMDKSHRPHSEHPEIPFTQGLEGAGQKTEARYNKTPKMTLNMKSPNEVEIEKLSKLMQDTGEIRCLRLFQCLTSFDN